MRAEDSVPERLRVPIWAYIVGAIVVIRLVASLMNQSGTQQEPHNVTYCSKASSVMQLSSPLSEAPQSRVTDWSLRRMVSSTDEENTQPAIPFVNEVMRVGVRQPSPMISMIKWMR